MTYSQSVVQLCPDAQRDEANALAEAAGYGPGNLGVQLVDATGAIWWGCHAWWTPAALEAAGEVPGVITTAREGGSPAEHWAEALALHGLSPIEVPE